MSRNDGVSSGFDMLHIGNATKSIFPNVGGGGMIVKIWLCQTLTSLILGETYL